MWTYRGEEFTSPQKEHVGFVYIIENLDSGRKYVGQKVFWNKLTRKPLKGKTNKRRSIVESDWMTYYGSSEDLKKDVEKLGPDRFRREIIRLCVAKSEMSYFEAKVQFDNDVLFSDKWYNGIINCRVGASKALADAMTRNPK